MGTTIEQYQSRNDCHNNFDKAKDAFSRVRGRLLEYDAYDVLLKCSLFANIKSWMLQLWNQVMFWFTQKMCCNAYIILNMRPDMSRNAG